LQEVGTDAERLLQHADAQVSPLGTKLAGAADTARAALADAQKFLRNVDGQVTPLAGSAQDTLTAARGTLGQANKSLLELTHTASPALEQAEQTRGGADGMIHNDLSHPLKALEEAAKSIRALADELQRHPESLLRGR